MIDLLTLFWLLLKASLFSTTGSGNLPILHQDLLARGWATDRQFAEALAIGQVSPGPTGLWVISLGYLVGGLRGALLSLVAITLPPLAVLAVAGFYRRFGGHPAMQGFVRGLSLAVTGIFLVVLFGIMRGVGFEPRALLIALCALGLGATRRVPVIGVMALAALAGILLYS
ncbi:MAG TPA: chromate transporter [Kouleothrix sp.]|uniref:chromate transporter n=1 Tax=Kouleothrix sp. TaxID=2779161 RepID=UPI002BA6407F|nr:chromate transporter [Kouleothrix sp.]HRC75986.1 chromate transporter [Kouleothrix sp.]